MDPQELKLRSELLTGPRWNGSERPMLSRAVIDEFRRERLLDAVAQTIEAVGCRRLTVAEIVKRSGTSRNSFYEFFDNKDEAVLAVVTTGLAALERRIEEACASAGGEDASTRLRVSLLAGLEWVEANPAAARVCLVESLAIGSAAVELNTGFQERMASRLAAAVPPDSDRPPAIAELVTGSVSALVSRWLVTESDTDLTAILPDLTEILQLLLIREAG